MATNRQHDNREYYMLETGIDYTTAAGTKAYFPIPRNGHVRRVYVTLETAHAGSDTSLTFQLGNVDMKIGGAVATLVIPTTASATGRTHVIEFSPHHPDNLGFEVEDGDLITPGGVLEVVSNAAGTVGKTATILVAVERN